MTRGYLIFVLKLGVVWGAAVTPSCLPGVGAHYYILFIHVLYQKKSEYATTSLQK